VFLSPLAVSLSPFEGRKKEKVCVMLAVLNE
jgi:hypothetical protein